MAWGRNVEIYVSLKVSEESSGKDVAFIGVDGEQWDVCDVRAFANRLRTFTRRVDKAIKKHGAEKLCVRTNT